MKEVKALLYLFLYLKKSTKIEKIKRKGETVFTSFTAFTLLFEKLEPLMSGGHGSGQGAAARPRAAPAVGPGPEGLLRMVRPGGPGGCAGLC